MNEALDTDWRAKYASVTAALSDKDQFQSGIFLCGVSACVDALISMHDMQNLLDADENSRAGELTTLLLERVSRGVGGEVRLDWPEGPSWLRQHLKIHYALGGTGPQAAWVLSKLGARALITLEDRHEQMLKVIPSGVLLAKDELAVEASDIEPTGGHVPEIFIFEFTAGQPIGDLVPKRSSRVIVRFCDRGIQHDLEFSHLSKRLASSAAAGLLSGLNDEPLDRMEATSLEVFDLGRAWMAAGLKTIHFELACYDQKAPMTALLSNARGAITSLGMSHSELLTMDPSAVNPMEAMIALAGRLDIDRICVHADTWAAAATVGDPVVELRALMAGCAVAAARAATGAPVDTVVINPQAKFQDVPFSTYSRRGKWTFVACSAPYLDKPAVTLGLGDSFTAGCLLVLGSSNGKSRMSNQDGPKPGHTVCA
ncbi:6-phosphofructokinase [Rhizobium sp. NZLR3b]|uniref:ADP-dependent glucokinase/phosphofructokinase n=1 Tax=Rhizobium sp. NZLR3b TaxID=2731101 RepID=UPI001C83191D|nr:ADP-dependent glucokinase/phosphofructokinase [Rhizobium sp. NZLR3b]MBX5193700.1 6-phosphofructokinase [Rhizobium sp. NZLR3b]